MITIATFSKPEEAHLLRLRLEAGGIPAYLQDEHLVQLDWLYSNAIGGVRVQIAEEDLAEAQEILNHPPTTLPDDVSVTCPSCSSQDVRPDDLSRRLSYAGVLFLGFPFFVPPQNYRCHSCGTRWNERRRPDAASAKAPLSAKTRWLIRGGVLAALISSLLVLLNPLHSLTLRLVFVGCLLAAWGGLLLLVWRRKLLVLLLLALPAIPGLLLLLPSQPYEDVLLRTYYVERLNEFMGAPYYWGGESAAGIDCSGLPRRAFRDALLTYGFETGNGQAFRDYLKQWWFDASARSLSDGERGYTLPTGQQGTIRELNYDELLPGDLAITTSGVHMLVYLGNGQWIQADPNLGKVLLLDGRTDESAWLDSPVTVHRWRQLR